MKLIIFDIDGTLTDTKNVDDKCFIKTFEKVFGIDIKNQDWNELQNVTDWGITEEIIQKEFNRLPTEKEYEQMIDEFVGFLKFEKATDISQFKAVKNATDFFNYIKNESNYKIGIATGGWEKSAKLKLETIGINLNGVALSNSNKYKSREDITKDVIYQLDGKSDKMNEVIYFGDGEWDFRTCQKLGIRFIGIDITNNGNLSKLDADFVFENFEEREMIIKKIETKDKNVALCSTED